MRDRRYSCGGMEAPRAASTAWNPSGFVRTLEGQMAALEREIEGLRHDLDDFALGGDPQSYIGEREFNPESQSITMDAGRVTGTSSQVQVNYVVRDATDYEIPIRIAGDGGFRARFMRVDIYQRIWVGAGGERPQEMWLPIPLGRSTLTNAGATNFVSGSTAGVLAGLRQTGKVSLIHGFDLEKYAADRRRVGTNFFWNFRDGASGRQLCQGLMSSHLLLHGSWQNQVDGGFYEFEEPWTFARGSAAMFQFRLINPILQLDASEATNVAFSGDVTDDLEGHTRRQSVVVRVELHGDTHFSERDLELRRRSG